mmetsp:Transcript_25359/g.79856  ORF Transcript_25359/g.79856 Transcript_25359/m.79856 type:complete len:275 (+) Transcript_25359:301-1125(+)
MSAFRELIRGMCGPTRFAFVTLMEGAFPSPPSLRSPSPPRAGPSSSRPPPPPTSPFAGAPPEAKRLAGASSCQAFLCLPSCWVDRMANMPFLSKAFGGSWKLPQTSASICSEVCMCPPVSPQCTPCRACSFKSRISLCMGAMSSLTSCLARRSSSSGGSQTEEPCPQDCSADTRRSMETLPSCLMSMMLKTSATRMPLLPRRLPPSGSALGDSRPKLSSTLVKASMSMGLKRSSTLWNASLTCWYLWQVAALRSSSTQEGANCLMPFTNSTTVR